MLPVAQRELLSASRLSATFWVRALISAFAFLVCLVLLWANSSPATNGQETFTFITGLAFTYALLSGVWLTAECISDERREGALGLLYLTRVGRWELMISKLTATSLRGFYGLIAIVPVAAVPVMLGGVTARELWQTPIILLVAMLLSLCAGLAASAIHVRSTSPQLVALGFIGISTVLGVFGSMIAVAIAFLPSSFKTQRHRRRLAFWSAFGGIVALALLVLLDLADLGWILLIGSPGYSWIYTWIHGGPDKMNFLITVSVPAFVASLYFSAAAYAAHISLSPEFERSQKKTPSTTKLRQRSKLIGTEPLVWLMKRQAPGPALLYVAGVMTAGFMVSGPFAVSDVWGLASFAPALLLAFSLARQAASGITRIRQSQILELLLTTPVTFPQIIEAQKRVYWRGVRVVLLITLLAESFMMFFEPSAGEFRVSPGTIGFSLAHIAVSTAYYAATLWVGMYLGYTRKKIAIAAGLTVFWTTVLPSIATVLLPTIAFRSGIIPDDYFEYGITFFSFAFVAAVYWGLIVWSRRRLARVFAAAQPATYFTHKLARSMSKCSS